jgi:hypothetical protein
VANVWAIGNSVFRLYYHILKFIKIRITDNNLISVNLDHLSRLFKIHSLKAPKSIYRHMPYITNGKSQLLLLPCHLAIYLADYDRRNNIRSSCARSINHWRYSDESSHIAFCWNRLVCMANPLDRSMVDLVSQNASYIESYSPSSNCNIDLFYIVHCIQYHDLLD